MMYQSLLMISLLTPWLKACWLVPTCVLSCIQLWACDSLNLLDGLSVLQPSIPRYVTYLVTLFICYYFSHFWSFSFSFAT